MLPNPVIFVGDYAVGEIGNNKEQKQLCGHVGHMNREGQVIYWNDHIIKDKFNKYTSGNGGVMGQKLLHFDAYFIERGINNWANPHCLNYEKDNYGEKPINFTGEDRETIDKILERENKYHFVLPLKEEENKEEESKKEVREEEIEEEIEEENNNILEEEIEEENNNILEEIEEENNNVLEEEIEEENNNILEEIEEENNNVLEEEIEEENNNVLEEEIKEEIEEIVEKEKKNEKEEFMEEKNKEIVEEKKNVLEEEKNE